MAQGMLLASPPGLKAFVANRSRHPARFQLLPTDRRGPHEAGLYAFTVDPFAPNLIAFRRVSSNFERM